MECKIRSLSPYPSGFLSPRYENVTDHVSELLSKSAEDVTREIKGMKSAISALTPDPQQAQAKSKQLDDILLLLSPISDITKDLAQVSESIRRWDSRSQGRAPYSSDRLSLNILQIRKAWTFYTGCRL